MKLLILVTATIGVMLATGGVYAKEGASDEVPEKIMRFFEKGIGTWTHEWKEEDVVAEQTFITEWGPGKRFLVNTSKMAFQGKEETEHSLMCWDGESPDGIIGYGIGPGGNIHENGRAKVISETRAKGTTRGVSDGKESIENWEIVFGGPDTAVYTFTTTTGGETSPVIKAAFARVKPHPEMKKLEGFVGEWTYEGEQADSDVAGVSMGPAGKYSGRFTARFVLDGSFLETKWQDEVPAVASGLHITGYDAKAKNYVATGHINDGSRSVRTATLDGRTWTSNSTMITGKGEEMLVKGVDKYSPDWASYTSTVEVSKDGGKTWKIWYTEEGKKLRK